MRWYYLLIPLGILIIWRLIVVFNSEEGKIKKIWRKCCSKLGTRA